MAVQCRHGTATVREWIGVTIMLAMSWGQPTSTLKVPAILGRSITGGGSRGFHRSVHSRGLDHRWLFSAVRERLQAVSNFERHARNQATAEGPGAIGAARNFPVVIPPGEPASLR